MDVATLTALVAMVISVGTAIAKILERWKTRRKENVETIKRNANMDLERQSMTVKGAEGALLLMEKTLKITSEDCKNRTEQLEDENKDLRCEITRVRNENRDLNRRYNDMSDRVDDLERRLRNMTTEKGGE